MELSKSMKHKEHEAVTLYPRILKGVRNLRRKAPGPMQEKS